MGRKTHDHIEREEIEQLRKKIQIFISKEHFCHTHHRKFHFFFKWVGEKRKKKEVGRKIDTGSYWDREEVEQEKQKSPLPHPTLRNARKLNFFFWVEGGEKKERKKWEDRIIQDDIDGEREGWRGRLFVRLREQDVQLHPMHCLSRLHTVSAACGGVACLPLTRD